MNLGKIKRNKKADFGITLLFIGIGALIAYLVAINTNGEETTTPEPPTCDGVCEDINPTPVKTPPEEGCFSSCPSDMKSTDTCSCEYTYDDNGNIIDSDCDDWCVPKSCKDMEGYVCEGDDVCPDCWVDSPDGQERCCSVPCVTPCGSGTNLECIPREEADTYDENSIGGGFAICSNGCPDYDYAVEYSLGNNEWCMKCAEQTGTTCCIYCPPKTYYCPTAQKCVGACACYSCEKKSGLPFNSDERSVSDYIDTGYSICKESCEDLNLGDGVVWKAYSIGGKADEWCSISNGGTDFEGYNKCCAYCPPETHYDPILLSCEPDSTVSELTWELNCPYIRLEWGEYENAVSYDILLFYDEDEDEEEDGSCPEDEINTKESPYYYDLSKSNCTEHYTKNVKLQLIPQYGSGEISVDSDETDWIDVSSCDFEKPFDDCTDGTKHDECSETKPLFCNDGVLESECVHCGCPEGYECLADLTCREIPHECGNNLVEATEECDGTDDDACPGRCLGDCTCPEPDCGNNIKEEGEECDGTDDDACPGRCENCVCPTPCDDSGDGPNGDWDNDLTCNDDDPDKDGDGVINLGDEEEWTPFGCEVDEDTGISIDNDEDGTCMGIDCNDYNSAIKIEKDDPLCTIDELCSNKEKDKQTNEIEIDIGGMCRPYIKLVEPTHGVSGESPFDIIISTDHDAECRYYTSRVSYKNMVKFEVSGNKEHKKLDYSLDEGKTIVLYVECDDGYWDPDDYLQTFEISVDSSKPLIHTYYAPEIIEHPLETVLVVGTDDKTICKYDTSEQDYELMENEFPEFDELVFKDSHQATITVDSEETKSYSYYVACKNRADLVSDTKEIVLFVNLDKSIEIEIITKKYNNESNVYLWVKTNKDSECFYGNTSDTPNSFGSGGYEHKVLVPNLKDGTHTYYVTCHSEGKSASKTVQFIVDTTPVDTPFVDDTSSIEDYPEYSYYTDKIRAKWTLDEKPLSGIDYFTYKIQDEFGNTTVNWTETDEENEWVYVDEDHEGEDINLTEGTKYFFFVKAKNMAGSLSEQGESDGVIVDPSKKPAECDDGIENGYETDIDCGGSECSKCDLTNKCLEDSDCHSGFCNSSNMCAENSCDDGVKNGDETDVDCGGSCDKCENDKDCKEDSDCESGNCNSIGICEGVDSCSNNRLDEDETDVDCGGHCAETKDKKCSLGDDCEENSDCSSGRCEEGKCASSVKDKDGDGEPDDTDNCPSVSNKFQENMDGDEYGDACDDDNDNDEMPDDWEEEYGLSIDFDDSSEDKDDDGLTNYDEYTEGTDPTNRDTDGDGISDGDEIERGLDPTDPSDKPKSKFLPWFLLILGIILVLAGLIYLLFYKPKNKPKKSKSSSFTTSFPYFKPGFNQSSGTSYKPASTLKPNENSIELRRKQAMENIRNDRERFKNHDKIFNTFETAKQSVPKDNLHQRLEIVETKIIEEPEKKEKKLTEKKTASKPEPKKKSKTSPKKEKRPKDIFERLSVVATAELKKYKKKKK